MSAQPLKRLLADRILLFDGAMGTRIQALRLDEADFRGSRFAEHPKPLKGCNDILCLTQPQAIEKIHEEYLEAGADVVETNTFNANAISMLDYGLEDLAYEINRSAAVAARTAVDGFNAGDGGSRLVAGSMGPTNRTASMSPDVNDPGFRAVTFDQLAAAYYDQARGLVDGGVDL
ncbi:MAG: homocysteine S-methyltransferase family protein, partial [Deltaproteobacteria bacterium]|nr:homocysteine S-methyltransferase family protein [Deltaproteobacteria bacterium]